MRARLPAYRRALAACCAVAGLAAVLAACGPASSSTTSGSSHASTGSASNSVTYAMQPGGYANYPFPFFAGQYISDDSVYNVNDFQAQLYRPLYWFGTGTTPYLNPAESLADIPSYAGHHVTIRLKRNYKW